MRDAIFSIDAGAESSANLHGRMDRGALCTDGTRKLGPKFLPESICNLDSTIIQNILFIMPIPHQPKNRSCFETKGPLIKILPVDEADGNIPVDDNDGGTDIEIGDRERQVIQSTIEQYAKNSMVM